MYADEQENPLHDIHPGITYKELEEIDLEPFFGAPDSAIEDHIRRIAVLASIGQLRQVLAMPLDAEDVEREVLVQRYVEKKMSVVRTVRRAMVEIG
jgi:hypothetical protein